MNIKKYLLRLIYRIKSNKIPQKQTIVFSGDFIAIYSNDLSSYKLVHIENQVSYPTDQVHK